MCPTGTPADQRANANTKRWDQFHNERSHFFRKRRSVTGGYAGPPTREFYGQLKVRPEFSHGLDPIKTLRASWLTVRSGLSQDKCEAPGLFAAARVRHPRRGSAPQASSIFLG
jgi:hypothetical protein